MASPATCVGILPVVGAMCRKQTLSRSLPPPSRHRAVASTPEGERHIPGVVQGSKRCHTFGQEHQHGGEGPELLFVLRPAFFVQRPSMESQKSHSLLAVRATHDEDYESHLKEILLSLMVSAPLSNQPLLRRPFFLLHVFESVLQSPRCCLNRRCLLSGHGPPCRPEFNRSLLPPTQFEPKHLLRL